MTVKIDVGVAVAQVGGGAQDFVIPGFDEDVVAVIFDTSYGLVDDTAAVHAHMGRGWCDGTNEHNIATISEDGVASTNTRRRAAVDSCIEILDNSAVVDGKASFAAFITDGVRVTWSNAPSAAFLIKFILIGGDDVTTAIRLGSVPGPVGTSVDIDMGLVPDLILAIGTGGPWTDVDGSALQFIYGVGHGPSGGIVQRAQSVIEVDGSANGNPQAMVATNRIGVNLDSAGGISRAAELTDILSTPGDAVNGIEVTNRGPAAFAQEISFLGLNFNNAANIYGGSQDAPIVVGDTSFTGVGFVPQFIEMGLSLLPSEDVVITTPSAGSFGIGSFSADNERCLSMQIEDAAATTNTQSVADGRAVNLPTDNGTIEHVADFVSMDADGWTLNATAAPAPGDDKWIAWGVEEGPPPRPGLPEYGQGRAAIGDPSVYGATIVRS